jgi:transmembrane protein DUF3566
LREEEQVSSKGTDADADAGRKVEDGTDKAAPSPAAAASNGGRPAAKPSSASAESDGIAPIKDEPGDDTPSWAKSVDSGGSVFNDRPYARSEPPAGGPAARPGGPAGPGGPPPPGAPTLRPATNAPTSSRPGTAMARPSGGKAPRKAQLQLARLEPWSVMKFSFVMSLVCFVVLLVAVVLLYVILSSLGVFDSISDLINSLNNNEEGTDGEVVNAAGWFSFARIFGYTVLVGALNVLLITALATVGSVIYNLAADLVGGVEVTLKEAE